MEIDLSISDIVFFVIAIVLTIFITIFLYSKKMFDILEKMDIRRLYKIQKGNYIYLALFCILFPSFLYSFIIIDRIFVLSIIINFVSIFLLIFFLPLLYLFRLKKFLKKTNHQ
jgi:hypothetical protein